MENNSNIPDWAKALIEVQKKTLDILSQLTDETKNKETSKETSEDSGDLPDFSQDQMDEMFG